MLECRKATACHVSYQPIKNSVAVAIFYPFFLLKATTVLKFFPQNLVLVPSYVKSLFSVGSQIFCLFVQRILIKEVSFPLQLSDGSASTS